MNAQISVAMATYNGATFLKEQLRSLSAQKTLPQELLVTDDGSTDTTLEILEHFSENAPFSVQIRQNKQRLGYGRNFLKAASLCTTEYVAFCDQDDVWHQNKLQIVLAVIDQSAPDIVVHSGIVVDQTLQPLGDRYPDIRNDGWLDTATLNPDFFWPGYAIVMKHTALVAWGMEQTVADDTLCLNTFAHDRWIFDAAKAGASCYLIADELVKYRQHASNHIGFGTVFEQMTNFSCEAS
jgi:glycosyltransferase involved in cell wall biosynthesis